MEWLVFEITCCMSNVVLNSAQSGKTSLRNDVFCVEWDVKTVLNLRRLLSEMTCYVLSRMLNFALLS